MMVDDNDNLSDKSISDNISDDSGSNNPYKLITRRIDSMKIRNNHKKDLEVTTTRTKDMDVIRDIAVRAGAVIYTKEGDKTFFCFGIDTQSGNLTDFGGGVKKGETIVEGGLRELHEESLNVFSSITQENMEKSITFHCFNMAIMFIPMEVDRSVIEQQFKEKVNSRPFPEVCDVVWLTTDEVLESIHGRGKKLYIRVRRLLSKVTNSIAEL